MAQYRRLTCWPLACNRLCSCRTMGQQIGTGMGDHGFCNTLLLTIISHNKGSLDYSWIGGGFSSLIHGRYSSRYKSFINH